MVKVASSTSGVFLVGPSNDKLRPWCGKCHKFLKSETAEHDCTPVNLAAVRRSKSSSTTKKRSPKLTEKKLKLLNKYLDYASVGKVMASQLKKLQSSKTSKAKINAVDAYKNAFKKAVQSNSFNQAFSQMYKHFVK